MSIFSRFFHRTDPREIMAPLYRAVIAQGRQPHWFAQGRAPDTLDGRFDMIATILCLVLLRLEGGPARQESVWLTELFVEDMDGQLRQIGIGDMIVGKHIGKMMSALGGRLTAYRAAFAGGDLEDALVRNLYRGASPGADALSHMVGGLTAWRDRLRDADEAAILAGDLPQ